MLQASLLELLSSEAQRDGVQQFVVGAVVQHDGKVLLLQTSFSALHGWDWRAPVFGSRD
jgi:8-oxo-dGTP diphosphatase